MRPLALTLLAGAALVAAGCGDRTDDVRGDRVLRGGILYFGGPAGPGGMAEQGTDYKSGTVSLYDGDGKITATKLDDGEPFEFHVRRGTYRLRTDLGDLPCERVVEVAQARVTADLECAIK